MVAAPMEVDGMTVATTERVHEDRATWLGRYAVLAGAGACLVSPLLGLAYFGTGDGSEELDVSSVAWWAEPAADWLSPLLTWAEPNRVYSTYVQLMALLFPAVLLCAMHARRSRTPRTRAERVGWRLSLTGYGLGQVGVALVALFLVPGDPDRAAVDVGYLAVMVPGLLLSMIGSTTVGISLLRGGWTPRSTASLLAISFPFWFAISFVLGHNSLGMLAMFLAWATYGRSLLRQAQGSRPTAAAPAFADLGVESR
jgi:hypothetical protein